MRAGLPKRSFFFKYLTQDWPVDQMPVAVSKLKPVLYLKIIKNADIEPFSAGILQLYEQG
jgi:hypothetical protein